MKHSGIYQIQSILFPERSYIGSAIDLNDRKQVHLFDLRRNKHTNSKLQNHFNKYGESDLVFEIVESGDYFNKNHLLAREQGWFIPYSYRGTNKPYFNIVPIAGSRLGTVQSEEQRKANGDRRRGTTHSEETKQLLRDIKLGTHQSEEHIKNAAESHKKSILQYDLSKNFIKEWPSAVDASNGLSINRVTIYMCCKHYYGAKTGGGFIWEYKLNNMN
jgi:group I intron endonuclease